MSSHLLLVQNLFNERQDGTRVVDASAEASGYEAWHVANGRRKSDDHWRPTAPNTNAWVRVDAGLSVTCDVFAIDRGHNLSGKQVKLQRSSDLAFSSPIDVADVTIPSSVTADRSIDNANGARTEEGAFIKRFTPVSSRYWRLFIPAAASFTPQVVGLWLGEAWSPYSPFDLPYEEENYVVGASSEETDFGWRSSTTPWRRREGSVSIRLDIDNDQTKARTFYLEATRHRPFWLVHSVGKAEQAVLAIFPPQVARRAIEPRWFPHTLQFAWQEWEPLLP